MARGRGDIGVGGVQEGYQPDNLGGCRLAEPLEATDGVLARAMATASRQTLELEAQERSVGRQSLLACVQVAIMDKIEHMAGSSGRDREGISG